MKQLKPGQRNRSAYRNRGNAVAAYTLIEMLVALVMFGIISVAISMALDSALDGKLVIQNQVEQHEEVRNIFGMLARDLRTAYASSGNVNTFFIGSGEETGNLLTFTSFTARLHADNPIQDNTQTATASIPQSDMAIIGYSYDQDSHTLSRTSTTIPNPEAMPQTTAPEAILSRNVQAISFSYTDSMGNESSDWNFDNQAAQQAAQGSSSSTDASSSTSTDASSSDTSLPIYVKVTLGFDAGNARTVVYTTTIAITTPQPQALGQKPANASASTGTVAASGIAGTATTLNRSRAPILPNLPGIGDFLHFRSGIR